MSNSTKSIVLTGEAAETIIYLQDDDNAYINEYQKSIDTIVYHIIGYSINLTNSEHFEMHTMEMLQDLWAMRKHYESLKGR